MAGGVEMRVSYIQLTAPSSLAGCVLRSAGDVDRRRPAAAGGSRRTVVSGSRSSGRDDRQRRPRVDGLG